MATTNTPPPPTASAESTTTTTTPINTAPGVTLTPQQNTLVSSVLDLFAGRPSRAALAHWADDATFADPITVAQGRRRFEAQWYGLAAVFGRIERLAACVTSGGNPIEMDMKTRYTVKGVGVEKVIESVVCIHVDGPSGKIVKVEDKWNGSLPDGVVANAFRQLNAVTVPLLVSVPKDDQGEKKSGD